MDTDIYPNNPPPKKNFEEADKIIHLDYPQLMRAVSYVNEIVEEEIEAGIPPEKIFVAGYSQGGLLTLATTLISQHKLETPCLIINNSKDIWVPFWTGKKSYDLLKERGYNAEFKTCPGLGHD
ncbi:7424_t:CDS:2 [Entrophospora sp. SA101]|nr:7424_t:CDS:2 [Entrophospora sp. SA101]